MQDPRWLDAASLAAKFKPKSIVGPGGFSDYLDVPEFSSYAAFHEQFRPSLWILHRGMADEWPLSIRRQLLSRNFRIKAGNDVFSILEPCATPAPDWSLLTTYHGRSLSRLLRDLQTNEIVSPPVTSQSLSDVQEAPAISEESSQPAPPIDKYEVDRIVRSLADVTGWEAADQPNTSSTGELLRDLRLIKANIKTLAWRLEQLDSPPGLSTTSLDEALAIAAPEFILSSRLCTSNDIYSSWHRALAAVLRSDNYKLRKIWEWTFTLKALHSVGLLNQSSHGLGFGCGTEPLASCLANYTQRLLVTDAPPEIIDGKGWSDTNQHASSLERSKYDWLAPRTRMDAVMEFDFVDMNSVPSTLHNSFDFVWSSCALEHLGSKENGLKFIADSALCLKPGGVAVHTTEFDLSGKCPIDHWDTVLFSQQDLAVALPLKLRQLSLPDADAHFELVSPDFRRGSSFIDGYVDIPPYSYHWNPNNTFRGDGNGNVSPMGASSVYPYPQLNLSVDGYPSTSVALVVRRLS